ncbi:chorismate-binding protein [Branchiibius sp. NY16-3462-2]|uniref:chorismate-binding protein n=1 Tax=Branchiibius sp. NY16-3462-2 TaxID=1807500 RepID=UPI0025BD2DBC|nr:chorismate-binding protein [Branchiibius sp. NY16-3462-2]
MDGEPHARFREWRARQAVQIEHDPWVLDEPGFWVVALGFAGELTAVRFDDVRRVPPPAPPSPGRARAKSAPAGQWRTSLDRSAYVQGVQTVRDAIADGTVYQVNVCRVLEREVPAGFDLDRLDAAVRQRSSGRYGARVFVPAADLDIVCASPELYLSRDGEQVTSGPIKGTAVTLAAMLDKDYTENVMITDLVRNDLQRVCQAGTVRVDGLCLPEEYPGSVHLVSHVSGTLAADTPWAQVLAASFPPGSVSGAPKHTALQMISAIEPVDREIYCGAIGYVDNRDPSRPRAELAVAIRTFWRAGRTLRFGVGAGITWASDPQGEWWETDLKARWLVELADAVIADSPERA